MADTDSEKLKQVELDILETQWPTCKTYALVDPLANKLPKEEAQTSLKTLVEVKAEALVVEKEELLTNILTYTITQDMNDTIAYTLPEVDAEVMVV